ncbi:transposase [Arthrobacter sp. ZGTC412]|uniref:transposase n=1 Tax=Arthrobacter sp. ZGTC412 TaxID=2058900 RepID=UPI00215852D5|nr:transposase [Arthrobacter sp. ZGTC412]
MAADALVLKVREVGRMVNVHAMVATGVNADGVPRGPGDPGLVRGRRRRVARILPRPDRLGACWG